MFALTCLYRSNSSVALALPHLQNYLNKMKNKLQVHIHTACPVYVRDVIYFLLICICCCWPSRVGRGTRARKKVNHLRHSNIQTLKVVSHTRSSDKSPCSHPPLQFWNRADVRDTFRKAMFEHGKNFAAVVSHVANPSIVVNPYCRRCSCQHAKHLHIAKHNKAQHDIVQLGPAIQAKQIYRTHGSDTMDCDDFCRTQDAVQFYYKYWKNTADYAQFKQRSHSQLTDNETTIPCCCVIFFDQFFVTSFTQPAYAYTVMRDELEKRDAQNAEYCHNCFLRGDLLCCDFCPRSFHLPCLGPPVPKVPTGEWRYVCLFVCLFACLLFFVIVRFDHFTVNF